MPEAIITAPDGKKYRVMHPEGASQDEIISYVKSSLAGKQPDMPEPLAVASSPPPSSFAEQLGGAARAGASGLVGSLESIGQIFSPRDLAGSIATAITGDKIPTGREMSIQSGNTIASALAGRKVAPLINDVSELPADQRPLGVAAEFAGSSLPFAGAGIAPILTGAAGGYAAEKIAPGNKIARALMEIGGGMAAGIPGAIMRSAQNKAITTPDTVQALKDKAGIQYQALKDQGVRITPQAFRNMVGDIFGQLTKEKVDATLDPKVFSALKKFDKTLRSGVAPSIEDVDILRQVMNRAAGAAESDGERRLAMTAINILDDHLDNLQPQDMIGAADPKAAVALLQKAQELWSRAKKGEEIETLVRNSQLAGKAHSPGASVETTIRDKFLNLATDKDAMRRFSPEEQAAITKVVEGGNLGNAMRNIGYTAAPAHPMLRAMTSGAGYLVGGLPGAVATNVVGEGLRYGSRLLTEKNARIAAELARRGAAAPSLPSAMAPIGKAGAQAAVAAAIQAQHDREERKRKDKR